MANLRLLLRVHIDSYKHHCCFRVLYYYCHEAFEEEIRSFEKEMRSFEDLEDGCELAVVDAAGMDAVVVGKVVVDRAHVVVVVVVVVGRAQNSVPEDLAAPRGSSELAEEFDAN